MMYICSECDSGDCRKCLKENCQCEHESLELESEHLEVRRKGWEEFDSE